MEHCCKMGKQKTLFVFRYKTKVYKVQRIHKESNQNPRDELGNIWSSQQNLKTDKEHTKQDNRKD